MKKKDKPASKLPKVDAELIAQVKLAQSNLETFLKKNKLDPTKDWSKDKKHGEKYRKLVSVLAMARGKVEENAPKEIHHKKSEDKKSPKKKSSATGKAPATKYDYPKVDGREMTAEEKKKYRTKMRNEQKSGDTSSTKAKSSKKEKVTSKEEVKAKSSKKAAEAKKPLKKKKKIKRED